MAETFTDYMGALDFSHASHWSACYCRFYHTNCSYEEWQRRTGDANCAEAISHIRAGKMKGYLAYDGDKCIGWCNANDAREYIRLANEIKPVMQDRTVGCVICFVVDPQYRRQGVAKLLLKHAIAGFRDLGYDAVLALPVETKDNPEKLYRGTINMYREQGFEEIERHGDLSVMRLSL
jgi:GNAT superfamily N-acetyltransferase